MIARWQESVDRAFKEKPAKMEKFCKICLINEKSSKLHSMFAENEEDATNYQLLMNVQLMKTSFPLICLRCSLDLNTAVKLKRTAASSIEVSSKKPQLPECITIKQSNKRPFLSSQDVTLEPIPKKITTQEQSTRFINPINKIAATGSVDLTHSPEENTRGISIIGNRAVSCIVKKLNLKQPLKNAISSTGSFVFDRLKEYHQKDVPKSSILRSTCSVSNILGVHSQNTQSGISRPPKFKMPNCEIETNKKAEFTVMKPNGDSITTTIKYSDLLDLTKVDKLMKDTYGSNVVYSRIENSHSIIL